MQRNLREILVCDINISVLHFKCEFVLEKIVSLKAIKLIQQTNTEK
jgi:hypothetical protein